MASVRSASSNSANNSATVVVTKPGGTVAGDVLIAYQQATFGALTDMTTPSGGATWQELEAFGPEFDVTCAKVWWKVAGSSEPGSYTFNGLSAGDYSVIVVAVEGATSATPLDASVYTSGGAATSVPTPSVTAGGPGIEVRFAGGTRSGTTTWTPPAGYSEHVEVNSPGSDKICATAASKVLAGAGATGALDFTASAAMGGKLGASVVLAASSLNATVDAATVTGAGNVPAPVVRTGMTARPAVVTGAGNIPAPGVHTGSTARPATVTGVGSVPVPNVVAGSAELIEPTTVTGTGSVPAPSITAVQNRTVQPSVVTGAGSVPAPTVTATFQATIAPSTVEGTGVVPSPGVMVPVLPGQFITEDGQVEFNGVVWGAGTLFRVREITGWEARPQVDDLTVEEANRHGALAGSSFIQRRIVQIRLQIDSVTDPTQVSGLLRQLRYDTRTLRDNSLWSLVIRGYTETLLAYGKCIDRTGVMDGDYSVGAPEPVITIMCPDPRRYSLEQHSAVVPANASTPVTLANDGELYTNPVLRFQGPAVNPLIINESLDRILAFNLTLGASDLLIVDTQRGTVKIGNTDHTNDISDTISVPVKEWFLEVGSSQVSYETDSGGAAGVEVLWRDAHE
ncbi:hypothetical protein ACFXJ8_25965 [Nonomuraea sp. NPDC059194]|uniref:hypothetical protein n=1 Tax=Nonomuraea sp. NPDC059194 TaxID=3346764 RepID=UPI0036C18B0D